MRAWAAVAAVLLSGWTQVSLCQGGDLHAYASNREVRWVNAYYDTGLLGAYARYISGWGEVKLIPISIKSVSRTYRKQHGGMPASERSKVRYRRFVGAKITFCKLPRENSDSCTVNVFVHNFNECSACIADIILEVGGVAFCNQFDIKENATGGELSDVFHSIPNFDFEVVSDLHECGWRIGDNLHGNPWALLSPHFEQLSGGRIGLSGGLGSNRGKPLDGLFQVARIAGNEIGSNGDEQYADTNNAIDYVNYSNLSPQRLYAWGLVVLGGIIASLGWLWILAASRRNLTVAQTGWRGIVALGLIACGLVLIWQFAPPAFAI